MSELKAIEAAYVLGLVTEALKVKENKGVKPRKEIKLNSKIKVFFNKIGFNHSGDTITYKEISRIVNKASHPELATDADWKECHKVFYNETDFINFNYLVDVYSNDPEGYNRIVDQIRKIQPVPIYDDLSGDYGCITNTAKIVWYSHETEFDGAMKNHKGYQYSNFKEFYDDIASGQYMERK